MKTDLVVLLIISIVLSAFCLAQKASKETIKKGVMKEVDGEVFIVTKSAGNIKLGLVTVYFLTEKQYKFASDINSPIYLYAINHYNVKDSVAIFNNEYDKLMSASLPFREGLKDAIAKSRSWSRSKPIPTHSDTLGINIWKEEIRKYDKAIKTLQETGVPYTRFRTDKRAEYLSIKCFVDSVKQEVISDKTNSDGKFRVELKNQKYWVCANSTRQVYDESEEYCWAFEYTPDSRPLFLSNDNMK